MFRLRFAGVAFGAAAFLTGARLRGTAAAAADVLFKGAAVEAGFAVEADFGLELDGVVLGEAVARNA